MWLLKKHLIDYVFFFLPFTFYCCSLWKSDFFFFFFKSQMTQSESKSVHFDRNSVAPHSVSSAVQLTAVSAQDSITVDGSRGGCTTV